jgi:DNA-binding NarL/FixJ family response regulator
MRRNSERCNPWPKPSVLLAEDDVAYRNALQTLLEPQFSIVAAVGDGQALLETVQTLAPDIVISDISMPMINGIQALRRLKANRSPARVIFLTVHEDPAFVREAEKSGADGYVLKRCAPTDLVPAIRKVLQGSPFVFPPSFEERLHCSSPNRRSA